LRLVREAAGIALVVTLLVMMLLSIVGLSLALITMTEERVATAFRNRSEVFYAADAMLERVVEELTLIADWNLVLSGSLTSSLVDPLGATAWPDDLAPTAAIATAMLQCNKPACSSSDVERSTQERPWGSNNPRWQLFAYGPFDRQSPSGALESPVYVAAWVGDDASENDGDPWIDGDERSGPNPGRGVVEVIVQAYGRARDHQVIEATLTRTSRGVRVLSWRAIR